MSAIKQRQDGLGAAEPEESGEYVRVPAVIDAHGDKIVTLLDAQGRPKTRLIAELVLEAFRGPCPPGHTLRFKDGNRLNCELTNLEWAAGPVARDEAARSKAIATRERADAIRQSLEGRRHSDSGRFRIRGSAAMNRLVVDSSVVIWAVGTPEVHSADALRLHLDPDLERDAPELLLAEISNILALQNGPYAKLILWVEDGP